MAKKPVQPDVENAEADDLIGAAGRAATSDGRARPNYAPDSSGADPYAVSAGELRQFVEQLEQLEDEKKSVSERQKELMAEAKGRGYDTKILRKIIAERKRKPDDLAEEQAVLDIYRAALGMV